MTSSGSTRSGSTNSGRSLGRAASPLSVRAGGPQTSLNAMVEVNVQLYRPPPCLRRADDRRRVHRRVRDHARASGRSSRGDLRTDGFTKLTDEQRANIWPTWASPIRSGCSIWHWVKDIARGDFGRSFFRAESVADMICPAGAADGADRAAVGGVLLAGRHPRRDRQRPQGRTASGTTSRASSQILFLAVPGFWFGMLIVLAPVVRVWLSRAAGRGAVLLRIRWSISRSSSARDRARARARRPTSPAWRDRACWK